MSMKAEKHDRPAFRGWWTAAGILSFVAMLLLLLSIWAFNTWANLTMDEIIYYLTNSVEGVDKSIFVKLALTVIIPAALICIGCTTISRLIRTRIAEKRGRRAKALLIIPASLTFASAALLMGELYYINEEIHVTDYFLQQKQYSAFIDDNYVDPETVSITFPEKKRNLIYIYLESMEITFADEESGGAFGKNVIPGLTDLAGESDVICFSGSGKVIGELADADTSDAAQNAAEGNLLNGAYALPGATYTTSAMFAASSGVPLKNYANYATAENTKALYPGLTLIGDVMQDEGYSNYLFIGSRIAFGGRDAIYLPHGDTEIIDKQSFVNEGYIPANYNDDWWGLEDSKLFLKAEEKLSKISREDKPFFFTMLTSDTHSQDGYVCGLCGDEFSDQYSNVYACSSRRVAEFVEWCRQQDFYENTTIIISGDHLTMDKDFCNDVPKSYERRVYTAYINAHPAADKEQSGSEDDGECFFADDKMRSFSTMDNFPTALASVGAVIEGNRLGLGTNLFSDEETLIERFGLGYTERELRKNSRFMESKNQIEKTEAFYTRLGRKAEVEVKDDDSITVNVSGLTSGAQNVVKELILTVSSEEDGSDAQTYIMPLVDEYDIIYGTEFEKDEFTGRAFHLEISCMDPDGRKYIVAEEDYTSE